MSEDLDRGVGNENGSSINRANEFASKDYAYLWVEQSKLLWSRMQTCITIIGAVITAWYFLDDKKDYGLSGLIALYGLISLVLMTFIVWRDAGYLGIFKDKAEACGQMPKVANAWYLGRTCAMSLLVVCDAVIAGLAVWSFFK